MREVKLGEKHHIKGQVVVIGGGNVAVDAARTALRLGTEKVTLACLECRAEMPAFAWEIEKAEGKGLKSFLPWRRKRSLPKYPEKCSKWPLPRWPA